VIYSSVATYPGLAGSFFPYTYSARIEGVHVECDSRAQAAAAPGVRQRSVERCYRLQRAVEHVALLVLQRRLSQPANPVSGIVAALDQFQS
jgi:hypothetical protein